MDLAELIRRERLGVLDRLEARIEEAVAAIIADLREREPELASNPEALEGLRAAGVASTAYAVACGREVVHRELEKPRWERGEPAEVAESARFMAREGISLELLLRAYRRAHAINWEIAAEEVGAMRLDEAIRGIVLTRASSVQFEYFDHLIAILTEAYTSELRRLTRGREQRRVKAVSRLLDGEEVGSEELGYRLEGHHLALIARGVGAESAAGEIASALKHQSLLVSRNDEVAWLWLGSSEPFGDQTWDLLRSLPFAGGVTIAAGESRPQCEGFRLSHRQAQVAARASWVSGRALVRYLDVALLATVLEHDTAQASFAETFLGELAGPGSRNAALRETLRAYYMTGQNAASAAAMLGASERTVRRRLRAIEEALGHPLDRRHAELEVALQILQAGATAQLDSAP